MFEGDIQYSSFADQLTTAWLLLAHQQLSFTFIFVFFSNITHLLSIRAGSVGFYRELTRQAASLSSVSFLWIEIVGAGGTNRFGAVRTATARECFCCHCGSYSKHNEVLVVVSAPYTLKSSTSTRFHNDIPLRFVHSRPTSRSSRAANGACAASSGAQAACPIGNRLSIV